MSSHELQILLLSGPPASGKDALSFYLQEHHAYHLGSKCKDSTSGSTRGYKIITPQSFNEKISTGDFIQWHSRYGRRYGLEWSELKKASAQGRTLIIHTGRLENLRNLRKTLINVTNKSVLLDVSRDVVEKRLLDRHRGDRKEVQHRLAAYDEEIDDYRVTDKHAEHDIVYRNDGENPGAAAEELHTMIQSDRKNLG